MAISLNTNLQNKLTSIFDMQVKAVCVNEIFAIG